MQNPGQSFSANSEIGSSISHIQCFNGHTIDWNGIPQNCLMISTCKLGHNFNDHVLVFYCIHDLRGRFWEAGPMVIMAHEGGLWPQWNSLEVDTAHSCRGFSFLSYIQQESQAEEVPKQVTGASKEGDGRHGAHAVQLRWCSKYWSLRSDVSNPDSNWSRSSGGWKTPESVLEVERFCRLAQWPSRVIRDCWEEYNRNPHEAIKPKTGLGSQAEKALTTWFLMPKSIQPSSLPTP